ncbi:MAG: hypothetical protein MJ225_01760 [Bacilli bacterium]|nr:hypothetical protein [Bacilli bacterium]
MKLTLRNIIIGVASLLAIVAFCLMFATTLNAVQKIGGVEYKVKLLGNVLGSTNMSVDGTKVAIGQKYAVCALSLAGYIMVLVGAIGALVAALLVKNQSTKRLILAIAAVVILVGAIFVLVQKSSFVTSEANRRFAASGKTTAEDKKLIHDEVASEFKNYKIGAAGIIAGVLGILSSLGLVAAQFVRED